MKGNVAGEWFIGGGSLLVIHGLQAVGSATHSPLTTHLAPIIVHDRSSVKASQRENFPLRDARAECNMERDENGGLFVTSILFLAAAVLGADPPTTPEDRALAYLSREVPRWYRENKCYSCHNNGDAARALYTAVRLKYTVPAKALADTTDWLARPHDWEHNRGDPAFSDKRLARLQFAAALADGVAAGVVKGRQALTRAAELLVADQRPDGSWQIEGIGGLGSPATYGDCLATVLARRTLRCADSERFSLALEKAQRWLRQVKVATVLDAAAVMLGLEDAHAPGNAAQRLHCLELIRKGQGQDGGWGPYVNSPAEPFDTAVVLLALAGRTADPETKGRVQRGRAFLLKAQQPDGSWPETTRPAGAETYAQRVSTSGWTTLALLATRGKD